MKKSLLLFTLLSGLALAGGGKGMIIPTEPVIPMPVEETIPFYLGIGLIKTLVPCPSKKYSRLILKIFFMTLLTLVKV